MNITQTDFRNALTEAMACSSENCWTWNMTSAFKTALGSTSLVTTVENNTLKRVSGITGLPSIAATNSTYK